MSNENFWSREELILALSLYFQLPFGKIHSSNPKIVELSKLIGRSSNSVALRLTNYAACDPYIISTGRHGMSAGINKCIPVWNEFASQKENLFYEAEKIKAKLRGKNIDDLLFDNPKNHELSSLTGETRNQMVKVRVYQKAFRNMILNNYQIRCAISGLNIPDLLVASHIIPWADNVDERLNPSNGICLSALYDKAFDKGLIAIDPNDYTVILSNDLRKYSDEDYFKLHFSHIERKKINLPIEHIPNPDFLQYHIDNIFSFHN